MSTRVPRSHSRECPIRSHADDLVVANSTKVVNTSESIIAAAYVFIEKFNLILLIISNKLIIFKTLCLYGTTFRPHSPTVVAVSGRLESQAIRRHNNVACDPRGSMRCTRAEAMTAPAYTPPSATRELTPAITVDMSRLTVVEKYGVYPRGFV